MKKINITLAICLLFFVKINAQTYHYLANFNSQGVPNNLTYQTVPQSLLNNISASFPEGYPVPTFNPQYIADGIDTDVSLSDSADVWVTFVQEGAGYKNVLGYYTYTGNPSAVAPSDVSIVFPNVSASGSGGGLNTGATVYLGAFPKGTKIGWFLIANGFTNSGNVGNGLWKLYSNPSYNPEPLASQRKHNVMLYDETSGIVALGFEDIKRDLSSCDQDFNDALFYVKSNPITAINTSALNRTVDAGSSDTGAGGGLESKLASKIATRLFLRQFNNETQLDKFEKQEMFAPEVSLRGDNLSNFIPEKALDNCVVKTSTPKDLTEITNAQEVVAVDYYNPNGNRLAAILATKTINGVYEHTKVICDRLVGAKLTEIRSVEIERKKFAVNKLVQPNGNIEYALSFSAYEENNELFIETQWGVDQFPKKAKFYNFQIWGNSPSFVQRLAMEVFAKLRVQYKVNMAASSIKIPQVYVKSGQFENGLLRLEIMNPIKATKLKVSGNLLRTEISSQPEAWKKEFALTGAATQTVEIQLGKIFDTGIFIENNKAVETDFMYLSDGVWSYGVNPNAAKIEAFEVSNDANFDSQDPSLYHVERNIEIKGKVKDYAAIFRTLRPSGKTLDLSKFRQLSFDASGKGTFEVVLVKKSIENWDEQFRCTVQLDANKRTITLPFAAFRSTASTKFSTNDIASVVIGVKGDNKNFTNFDLSVADMKFSKILEDKKLEVNVYPNPTSEIANFELRLKKEGDLKIELFDTNGRAVFNNTKHGALGFNQVIINLSELNDGFYTCRLSTESENFSTKIMVRKN